MTSRPFFTPIAPSILPASLSETSGWCSWSPAHSMARSDRAETLPSRISCTPTESGRPAGTSYSAAAFQEKRTRYVLSSIVSVVSPRSGFGIVLLLREVREDGLARQLDLHRHGDEVLVRRDDLVPDE